MLSLYRLTESSSPRLRIAYAPTARAVFRRLLGRKAVTLPLVLGVAFLVALSSPRERLVARENTDTTTNVFSGSHRPPAVERSAAANAAASAAQSLEPGRLALSPQDTWLNVNKTNYSTSKLLRTYTWPDYQPANVILMKFDLSALPAGAIVQEATLHLALVQSDATADGAYTVTAHKLIGKNPAIAKATGSTADGVTPWTPNGCCYNGTPLAQGDISPPYDAQAIDKTPGFKSWTITDIVRDWLENPATNFGLLLNADASKLRDGYRYFASMQYADASLRPFLSVTYAAGDATPPSVVITAPPAGAVSGTVPLTASATDNIGVAGVRFRLNDTPIGPEVSAYPYVVNWDTTTVSDGGYTLTAVARDWAGNASTSPAVGVTLTNGILLLSPQDTYLSINATNYSSETTLNAYTWPDHQAANAIVMKFDLSGLSPGAWVQEATLNLALVESDSATASTYTVAAHKLLKNPDITKATGYTADGVIGWTPNACCYDGIPLAQADISLPDASRAIDAAPGYKSWTITPMVQEWLVDPATNFGLLLDSDASQPKDRYRFFASAEHSDPSLRPFLRVKYLAPSPDTTPPSVAITTPTGGATVSGTTTVSAGASDNHSVAGVQFTLDGVNLGTEDTTAPYAVSWNTGAAPNGGYTLAAVARDGAGNVATSSPVAVTVFHDTAPPVVFVTAPTDAATVSGNVLVRANASDNVGVVGLKFTLDGASLGAEQTTAPYSIAWNTAGSSNGPHTMTAIARDAAGNTGSSAAVTVTVANDTTPPTVSLSSPANGATVSGAVSVTAGASDNVGVVGVQFRMDGATLGVEDTTVPYAISWNTATAADGSHTLTAVARDSAGNQSTAAGVTVSVSNTAPPPSGGIATRYPGDVGIETDPNVVFVERFDESTLTNLFSRWTDTLSGSTMSFSTDVPAGSPAPTSLNIQWSGAATGGHLYRQLSPGVDDALYVRYYVKYPTSGSYQHEGVWMGGYNPSLAWPNPQAGVKPTGSDRFSASAEQSDDLSHFDHYDYWMNMRRAADGSYWGNTLLNNPDVKAAPGQWMCVEHMVKLNNPVTALNGEHAIWVNGVKVSHLGQTFPNGYWSGGNFTQDPSGSPFEGFQWRSTTSLNLNWIWLQVYAPTGGSGSIKYAHVVAAKSYIGCLAAASVSSDTTPPTVSITSPVAGGTLSGAITVAASASDNVGVAGVQFTLDGANLGAEDTTSPYSVSWSTTTAANGSHALTAVARDAAGNQKTSTSVTVTVSNGSSGSGAVLTSNWDTATGTSMMAVTDGGRWPNYWEFNNGSTVQLLSVVSGGTNGHNALRVQQRGSTYAANLQIDNVVPQSTDYYLRYYMKNDDTSNAGDHIVTTDTYNYANLTYMRKYGGPSTWTFVASLYGCGYTYPIGHWGPSLPLVNGRWYRFEYYVHYVDATHIQVHPRIYDDTGLLILSDAHFLQSDFGSAAWNGRSDWTLASYYAAGHSFCVDPTWTNDFGLGNNGQYGAADTGQYWYFSAVEIRTDRWPGAVQ